MVRNLPARSFQAALPSFPPACCISHPGARTVRYPTVPEALWSVQQPSYQLLKTLHA